MPSRKQADDKTGGDLDGGRLAPGKEGRGGCRPQRAPILKAEASKDSAKLQAQCETVMEHLGHVPQLWFVDDQGTAGQMRCSACLMTAGFAENPMFEDVVVDSERGPRKVGTRQKDKVNGEAVEKRCPRAQ